MDRLPDELVLMVLECLPVRDRLQAARVCRRWRALALRRALHIQHHMDARAAAARHTALLVTARCCDLPAALSRTPYLSELTVHARVPLSATACTALYHLPHLQHLDVFSRERIIAPTLIPVALRLSSFVINETVPPGVLKALSHSRRLRSLHMYGRALYFPRRELTPLLTARRDHLRELTLRCAELPDSAYEVIGECHGLVTLRLYSCWLLTGAGAAHLTRPVSLRELHITGARMLRPTPLKEFLRALPLRLEELVLSAGWFGDEHISSLTTRVPGLRVLELWRCYLSARGVCELAAALPRLWELDIDTVLHAAELRLLAAHPTLSRLRCVPGEEATRASVTSASWSLTPATARYGRGCLRGGGEGWRSELLHHWSGPLRPLPPHAPPPAFDDDDEDDYSLLDLAPG